MYAAKSTEDRRGSIPDQLRECRQAIDAAGGRRGLAEYTDEAFSAFSRSRGPGLVDAMQHAEDLAEAHGSAELWAQHSDRLARGDGRVARHAVEIGLWALKRDISVRTVQDPDTFRDLLYAVVTGQRNHEDSRRKGLAMAAGRRRAASRGDFIGYKPDGYKLTVAIDDRAHVTKRMVIDPERREIIETIFRLALRGQRTGLIARALNDAGWRTKPVRRDIEPQKWTTERVGVVLRNPRYAALAIFDGEVVARGHWPAYITERQHERIRARMATHDRATKMPLRREAYLLAQLMRCGRCGEPIYCESTNRRRDGTRCRRYICASHEKDRDVDRCEMPPIAASMLEAMFVASLRALLTNDAGDEAEGGHTAEPATVVDLAWEQLQLRNAAHGGEAAFQQALESLLARVGQRQSMPDVPVSARQDRQLQAARRFEAWAAEEMAGRSDATRAEAAKLNRTLRAWFSTVTVDLDGTSLVIAATHRHQSGRSPARRQTTVLLDRVDWTRVACHVGRNRLRFADWDDGEILGALQAWTEIHGQTPTSIDWIKADAKHPNSKTVRRHFGQWDRAVRHAGLQTTPRIPPRNYPWSDREVIQALKDWASEHGREPKWHEWSRASPGRPCSQTVYEHFGGWPAGLAAARL